MPAKSFQDYLNQHQTVRPLGSKLPAPTNQPPDAEGQVSTPAPYLAKDVTKRTPSEQLATLGSEKGVKIGEVDQSLSTFKVIQAAKKIALLVAEDAHLAKHVIREFKLGNVLKEFQSQLDEAVAFGDYGTPQESPKKTDDSDFEDETDDPDDYEDENEEEEEDDSLNDPEDREQNSLDPTTGRIEARMKKRRGINPDSLSMESLLQSFLRRSFD